MDMVQNWVICIKKRISETKVETLGSAKFLIFINLDGGPSHVDTFDVKTGPWSPSYLDIQRVKGYIDWPMGIMPKLGNRLDDIAVLRSIRAMEAVHERGTYHMLTGHRLNPSYGW